MAGERARAAPPAAPGARVEMLDVELDEPAGGEVEVAITAAGVCGSDVHVVLGDWEGPAPVVLGTAGAGIVTRGRLRRRGPRHQPRQARGGRARGVDPVA